jgi:flavodoxin
MATTFGGVGAQCTRTSSCNQARRDLMAAMAGLTLAGATQASDLAEAGIGRPEKPILVAYFSRSGNTRVVAGLLQRSLGADLFEILPATPYPEDYLATVEQARQERDQGTKPALKATVPNIARYATVFLGLPIWGETAPPVIRSFLSAHDLTGKTLIPFITHGGYGLGSSESVIARHAPKAKLRRAFSMQAD